jgi:hypothetical protein
LPIPRDQHIGTICKQEAVLGGKNTLGIRIKFLGIFDALSGVRTDISWFNLRILLPDFCFATGGYAKEILFVLHI